MHTSVGGAGVVLAGGFSGGELAGLVGAVIGGMLGAITLIVTVRASNATQAREYRKEIQDSHDRGALEAKESAAYEIDRLRDILRDLRADKEDLREQLRNQASSRD